MRRNLSRAFFAASPARSVPAALMAVSLLSGCREATTTPPLPAPRLSHAAALQNLIDIFYYATLEGTEVAHLTLSRDGALLDSVAIHGTSFDTIFTRRSKGTYTLILSAARATPDTVEVVVPDYLPVVSIGGLYTGLDDYPNSHTTLDLSSRLSDHNPEDAPLSILAAVSPDGKTIATWSDLVITIRPVAGQLGPYAVQVEVGSDSGASQHIVIEGEIISAPAQIAYNSTIWPGGIHVSDTDDTNQRTVWGAGGYDPTWSPDGSKIAFAAFGDGSWGIFIAQLGGLTRSRVTGLDYSAYEPHWCSDGRIVFRYAGGVSKGIASIAETGEDLAFLVDDSTATDPKCSPNSGAIVFSTKRDGNREVYRASIDGTNQVNLTQHPLDDWGPAWFPNGEKVVFLAQREDTHSDLYAMDATGSNQARLTTKLWYELEPAVSPDGTQIVFTHISGVYPSALFLLNLDGGAITPIGFHSQNPRDNGRASPAWRPPKP